MCGQFRFSLQILDEKGYTEKKGYSGRVITDLGREKLEKGLIYDQVDFIYSKFEEMIYLTDFNYISQEGNVVVNTSTIYNEESINIMKEIFESGLSVSPYVNINEDKTTGEIEVTTFCRVLIRNIPFLLSKCNRFCQNYKNRIGKLEKIE